MGGVTAVGEETPHAPEPHGSTQMDPAGWTRTADRWMDEGIYFLRFVYWFHRHIIKHTK